MTTQAATTTSARIRELLTNEEIRDLTTPSNPQGFLSLATTWSMIAGSFALVAFYPTWWAALIAVVILGGRQLGLAVLMHECAHYSLFRTRKLNDILGKWLCAAPSWNDVHKYRKHHLTHHAHTGTEKDNDLGLVEPFPTTKMGLVRKILRDLSGLSGIKRVVGLLLMDLGFLTYSASTGQQKISQKGRPFSDVLRMAGQNLGPVFLSNFVLFAILAATGHPELYLLWIVAYLTTFSLFIRIRAMAEHACTELTPDMFRNTRTTRANWLARLTVAPHHVNYHLEHHLLMTVPHYHLKNFHKKLQSAGVYETSPYAPGYWDVLRTVGTPVQTAA